MEINGNVINYYKIELNFAVMFCLQLGADNTDGNPNIIFTIKKTKLYLVLVTLSAKYNQKQSKLLSKGFERSVYWNEYQTKSENKYTSNKYRHFIKSNFVRVNRLFALIYLNSKNDVKRCNTQKYYLLKGIIDNYNAIMNGKRFHSQVFDSDIKQYEEIRKLTTGQGEDYTSGCLVDYDYIKNHYRLITVDLSRQKELDAESNWIKQIENFKQLKKCRFHKCSWIRIYVYFNDFGKKQRNKSKIFSRTSNSIKNKGKLSTTEVNLTNTEFNKLKYIAQNKAETILRVNKKNVQAEELPQELFLATRQTNKVRNDFANNMSTDIELSKAQISQIIQSGGSLRSWLVNLGKKALIDLAIPLARDNLPRLVSNLTSNAINKVKKKK